MTGAAEAAATVKSRKDLVLLPLMLLLLFLASFDVSD